MARHTYTVRHVPGYSGVDHFGREVGERLAGQTFSSLASARRALAEAKRAHIHPRPNNIGRFEVVRGDGQRYYGG